MNVVALAGGVGGARLADGLAAQLMPQELSVVVNTGDDFDLLGLRICPDLDTVMYTLAGLVDPQTGWGLQGDSTEALDMLARYGADDWFRLGDRDLATHVWRSALLRDGLRLTGVTARLASALGVRCAILPMSDQPVATMVQTDEGELAFQDYFVRRRWQPAMHGVRFAGLESARPTPEVLQALERADVVVLCPSNPFVSLDPILGLPGVRERVAARPAIAVSPIIGGRAVKGPAAKMFRELGIEPSPVAVARRYADLLNLLLIDWEDALLAPEIEDLGVQAVVTGTFMRDRAGRVRLAREVLAMVRGVPPCGHDHGGEGYPDHSESGDECAT